MWTICAILTHGPSRMRFEVMWARFCRPHLPPLHHLHLPPRILHHCITNMFLVPMVRIGGRERWVGEGRLRATESTLIWIAPARPFLQSQLAQCCLVT